jgi:hypothetical protein
MSDQLIARLMVGDLWRKKRGRQQGTIKSTETEENDT